MKLFVALILTAWASAGYCLASVVQVVATNVHAEDQHKIDPRSERKLNLVPKPRLELFNSTLLGYSGYDTSVGMIMNGKVHDTESVLCPWTARRRGDSLARYIKRSDDSYGRFDLTCPEARLTEFDRIPAQRDSSLEGRFLTVLFSNQSMLCNPETKQKLIALGEEGLARAYFALGAMMLKCGRQRQFEAQRFVDYADGRGEYGVMSNRPRVRDAKLFRSTFFTELYGASLEESRRRASPITNTPGPAIKQEPQ